MWNTKFKKLVTFACVLLLQPIMSPGSYALAKRRKSPPKAFSFIAEGGKASQAECDGEWKMPRFKKVAELSKANSYMGSEMIDPEIKGKPGEEMWKHFFRVKASCNSVLAKTPSSVQSSAVPEKKPELPPEEAEESETDSDQPPQTEGPSESPTDGPDSE